MKFSHYGVLVSIAFWSSFVCSADSAFSGTPGSWKSTRAALQSLAAGVEADTGVVKCGFPLITSVRAMAANGNATAKILATQVTQRVERQKTKTAGGFTVHYDTSGTDAAALLDETYSVISGSADAYADSVLAIAQQVYAEEVGVLGYAAPPGDGTEGGDSTYDIYVESLGSTYGYTTPETALSSKSDGATYTSYLTIDNTFAFVSPDSNKGLPALRVTVAHEFHHAIQLGSYGYWTEEAYFHEITSTWMESVVFPGVNDNLNYVRSSSGHFKHPTTAFTSNGTVCYSRFIWCVFLAKKFDVSLIRQIWEEIRNEEPLAASDFVLQERGSSLKLAFAEWSLWNYFTADRSSPDTCYPQGALYPRISSSSVEFSSGASDETITSSLPGLSARYCAVSHGADTATIVVSNLDAAAALASTSTSYDYSIVLSWNASDDAFQSLVDGSYFKGVFSDASNWCARAVTPGGVVSSAIAEGCPFPNPFYCNGSTKISIPSSGTYGTLHVFDASMNLVYCGDVTSSTDVLIGTNVFQWDGRNSKGSLASSGIYFFVLETSTCQHKGKIALLRR